MGPGFRRDYDLEGETSSTPRARHAARKCSWQVDGVETSPLRSAHVSCAMTNALLFSREEISDLKLLFPDGPKGCASFPAKPEGGEVAPEIDRPEAGSILRMVLARSARPSRPERKRDRVEWSRSARLASSVWFQPVRFSTAAIKRRCSSSGAWRHLGPESGCPKAAPQLIAQAWAQGPGLARPPA